MVVLERMRVKIWHRQLSSLESYFSPEAIDDELFGDRGDA